MPALLGLLVSILFITGASATQEAVADESQSSSNAEWVDDEKALVPEQAALDSARQLVREVFGKQYQEAETDEQKLSIAKELLKHAEGDVQPAARYSLLTIGRDIAVQAGDPNIAIGAVDALDRSFKIDAIVMKTTVVKQLLASKDSDVSQATASAALFVVDDAIASEQFQAADELVKVILTSLRRRGQRGTTLTKAIAKRKVVAELLSEWEDFRKAEESLAENPNDAKASQIVGSYLFFERGDMAKGLPLLARGEDEQLAAAVKAEMSQPSDAGEQVELADLWWNLGQREKQPSSQAVACLERSTHWYRKALPELTGLGRVKATQRIEEIEERVVAAFTPKDAPRGEVGAATANNEILAKRVTLAIPYPETYRGAPRDRITVQYGVLAVAKQAGLRYEFDESQRRSGTAARRWVRPAIRNQPLGLALRQLLEPAGLAYRIDRDVIVIGHPATFRDEPERPDEDNALPTAAGTSVDLLKQVDVKRHAVEGDWRTVDGILVAPAKPFSRLILPTPQLDEYELTVVAEKTVGKLLVIGLVIPGESPSQFNVVLGYGGKHGLEMVDGKVVLENESAQPGPPLEEGEPSEIRCQVRDGRVLVALDGKVVIDWKGDLRRLSRPDHWAIPQANVFYLGTYDSSFKFSSIKLRTLKPASRGE